MTARPGPTTSGDGP